MHTNPDFPLVYWVPRQRMFNSSLYLRTKQQYCEYVRDFLWRNDVTSRGKAWLLTCVGVSW